MKRRLIALLIAALMVLSFAACAKPETPADPTEVPATDTVTDAPIATEEPTQAPTQAPTAEPIITGIDAVIVSFAEESDEIVSCSASYTEKNPDEPWVNIITDDGDNNVTIPFEDSFLPEDYPYFSFLYRVGYGMNIRSTNHLYAVPSGGGPSPADGMWNDIDWECDTGWHLAILNLTEKFPAATSQWTAMRYPTADFVGGELAIAYQGAFQTAEDAEAYYNAFMERYGALLVNAEAPSDDKEESVPDYEEKFAEFTEDFESYDDGEDGHQTDDMEYSGGARQSKFVDQNGNMVISLSYDALYYPDLIKTGSAYTLSFDIKNTANASNFGGVIFNWGSEQHSQRDFFENSGYEKDSAGSLVAHSGCGLFFQTGDKIKLYVPTYDVENGKATYMYTILETGIDFTADYVHMVISDDGNGVLTIKANDTVIATLEYSNPGLFPATVISYNERYYRTVVVKGPDGTELCSSESACFSVYKSFAFAGRAHAVYLDNISIKNG